MHEIVVLGGYGHLGRLCVAELVNTTRARIIVAGRNIQRAEQLVSAYEGRARASYANVLDHRTLQRLIPGSIAVIACCSADSLAALDIAIRSRVAFIGVTELTMDERTHKKLERQAWAAQVPVILHAGAVPGLPGVLAEYLVRNNPTLREIRIASTGPWRGSESARQSEGERRSRSGSSGRWLRRPMRWLFPQPLGARWVRSAESADLKGFVEAHCVERLSYLEPDGGPLARGVSRMAGRDSPEFTLMAQALPDDETGVGSDIVLRAHDPLDAAAAATGILACGILRGRMPGGFYMPREALNPATFLQRLEKRGIHVTTTTPATF